MHRNGWAPVLLTAFLVGIVALIADRTSLAQISGQADTLLTVRFTVSKLVNSGTIWGGLLILAGWLVRRPLLAPFAAIIAGEVALVVHYGLWDLLRATTPDIVFSRSDIWVANWYWFLAPLIFGPPLGLIGALARRPDRWGLLARLVVPVAAVVEPFLLGMFSPLAVLPAPDKISSIVCGVLLVTGGVVGATVTFLRWHRRKV